MMKMEVEVAGEGRQMRAWGEVVVDQRLWAGAEPFGYLVAGGEVHCCEQVEGELEKKRAPDKKALDQLSGVEVVAVQKTASECLDWAGEEEQDLGLGEVEERKICAHQRMVEVL